MFSKEHSNSFGRSRTGNNSKIGTEREQQIHGSVIIMTDFSPSGHIRESGGVLRIRSRYYLKNLTLASSKDIERTSLTGSELEEQIAH